MRIWDIREQQNVATFSDHSKGVSCISFSENGYLVATGAEDETVKIWDLRKLKCTTTLSSMKAPISSVSFDYSGK
jgi:pre-mRNA-processing factor 19